MMRLHIASFLLLLLVASCKEEEYYYPSVNQEIVTVKSGADGRLQFLIPDKSQTLPVTEDLTNASVEPNVLKRVISNYEVVSSAGGTLSARIYSLQAVALLEPKKQDDPAFSGGVKTDPVSVISIWTGKGYLNMMLNLKIQGGKQHELGIVEESVVEESDKWIVTFLLHHNAKEDEEYYNRRAYISIPMSKYSPYKPTLVKFKYHKRAKDGTIVESTEYCNPGIQYAL